MPDELEEFARREAEARESALREFQLDPEKYCLERRGLGYLGKGKGLVADARNNYVGLMQRLKSGSLEKQGVLQTYEDYVRTRKTAPEELADYLIENSRPEFILQYNKIVAEFNNSLDSIKQQNDLTKAQSFIEKLEALFQ